MIRRIVLENYMAHLRTVIEPAAGLTVLIGPNNCGKSAIIHALEMLCYNPEAAWAIRHGAKKAVVSVETVDDAGAAHVIQWWRTQRSAGYVIDGREISGLGKSNIPDDLHDHLRMPMIEPAAGGERFALHFGLQKSPIFLVDSNGPSARTAQFFASATDADKLVEMQAVHRKKLLVAKEQKKDLDVEIEQLDKQLQTLEPLPMLAESLEQLEADHADLVARAGQADALREKKSQIENAAHRLAWRNGQSNALAMLAEPPALHDTRPLRRWIDEAHTRQRQANRADGEGRALQKLQDVPKLDDIQALRDLAGKIIAAQKTAARFAKRSAALADLPDPAEPADSRPLHSTIEGIRSATQALADRSAELESLDRQVDRFASHIEQWVRENPRCTACGQSISADTILHGLAGEHAHA